MDFQLIKAMLDSRRNYTLFYERVPMDTIGTTTRALLGWIHAYYAANPTTQSLSIEQLKSYITIRLGDTVDTDGAKLLLSICDRVQHVQAEDTASIWNTLIEQDFAGRVGALYTRYDAGGEVALLDDVTELATEFRGLRIGNDTKPHDISEILQEIKDERGIKFDSIGILRDNVAALRGGKSIALAARPDKGKCVGLLQQVIMYDGSVKYAKDIVVGDKLASPTGYNTVTSTTTGRSELFEIVYPWGDSYTVNDVHVLSLKRSKAEGRHKHGDILNVPLDEYLTWSEGRKQRYKGWKSGIELPEKPQSIDPYVLGAWLGDGTTSASEITCSDPEVIQAFVEQYGEPSSVRRGITRYFTNGFMKQLRDLDLIGNKHIPDNYLRGSRQQRLELLAGLLDTDGYNTGTGFEIIVKDNNLAEQVVYLARSLSIHAVSKPAFKRATNANHEGDWYNRIRLGSEAHVVPLRVERKRLNQPTNPKRQGLQFGFEVRSIGVGDYCGWTLDGDHLFLLNDFTVTHNTSLLCQLATNIAPQCVDYFGVDRPILYLVNEGNERTIYPRMYQAALRKTMTDIYAMNDSGILIPEYEKVLNAPANYIQILPIHGFTIGQYRELVERLNPSFVITDMVEHVAIPNITSKPERITALWEQLRDLAIINDYIHMGTVQLGVEGGNCLFPTYEHINYSKTGIQAATDLILIMGALDGVEHQDLRGLSTPKNKQKVEGKPAYVETQMIFDMDRCYFNDGTGQVHTTTEITTESVMAQGGSHE